jgi:hypothetical protein
VYFTAAGATGKLIEATIVFPLTGIHQRPLILSQRIPHMAHLVFGAYGRREAVLIVLGILALVAQIAARLVQGRRQWRETLRDPLVSVVGITLLWVVGFAIYYNFQGPPDTVDLTPYAALGFGGAVALALHPRAWVRSRQVAAAATVALSVTLIAVSWVSFTHRKTDNRVLLSEYSDACGLQRILGATGTLDALGDPTPLVLTHRVNPDRFIYLGEQVFNWKITHTPGGFQGWVDQIDQAHPEVVIFQGWRGPVFQRMRRSLRQLGYSSAYLGPWHLFVTPQARTRALNDNVQLTFEPTHVATDLTGARLPRHACSIHA